MNLERFVPATDGESVRACHEIYLTAVATDDPHGPPMSPRGFAGWLALGWTEDPSEAWLARDGGGEACGWYVLSLPQRENRHLAAVSPVVHASRRRAGLGTALVRHAAARAQHLGRTLLSADTREGSPGSAFARAFGARQTVTEVRRVLPVNAVPAGRLARLRARAESAARGYSLVSWDGPVPEDQMAAVAAIYAASADSPREAGREAQRWDTERVRQDTRRVAAQGLRFYTVAAMSLAAGELAGLSQLGVDPAEPTWGLQELTAVARPHRGHRLGLLVKVAMLELLAEREPQLTRIITANADENEHMIAINVELGFGVLDRWPSWETEVAQALARPGRQASATSPSYGGSAMTYTADPRVDAYIDALPDWQQAICREVRDLVHAADPEVTETIKRTDRPYFVLQGNICALLAAKDHVNVFLYDGAIVPDPDGIITAGHDNKTARTVAARRGETINAPALSAMVKHIIANNRAGGWRKLRRES